MRETALLLSVGSANDTSVHMCAKKKESRLCIDLGLVSGGTCTAKNAGGE